MKVLFCLLPIVLTSSLAYAGNYMLMTKTYGGEVNLVKELSKKECEIVRDRVLGLPVTEKEKESARNFQEREKERIEKYYADHPEQALGRNPFFAFGGCGVEPYGPCPSPIVQNGDIRSAECFNTQPE